MAIQLRTVDCQQANANSVMPVRCYPYSVPDNCPSMQIFWDDAWTGKAKGIVMFLAGGSGRGQIDTVSSPRPVTACGQGYIYINCLAPQRAYTAIVRQNQFPVHDYYAWPLELQSHLQTWFGTEWNNAAYSAFTDNTQKAVVCGTSRGAGVIVQWSEMSRKTYNLYSGRVAAIMANAPAGSLDTGEYRDAYAMVRAFYRFFNNVNHKLLATVGANDITNMPRAAMERAYKSITNSNWEFKVVGDSTYPHTWPYLYPAEFINLAITQFPTTP